MTKLSSPVVDSNSVIEKKENQQRAEPVRVHKRARCSREWVAAGDKVVAMRR